MPRIRADRLLVERGLAPSIEQAGQLIMAGRARAGTQVLVQPGTMLPDGAEVEVSAARRYVSRGGLKLEGGLTAFDINPAGLHCLDVGASTGGFTDCLLQHGASQVIAVDVGRGLLHARLRGDARVAVVEGVNARDLPALPPVGFFVADLSFISLRTVLPSVAARVPPRTPGIVLFKPQFEAARDEVPRDGVVRDARVRARALERFRAWAEAGGWGWLGVVEAPVTGDKGNQEQLVHLRCPEQPQC
jgi:23S rRNA (cytidine1920-2'-O)/16S rRNA (cytidine1409-2'-O)-methyltransferase